MSEVGVTRCKHSIENQLNLIIKINTEKKKIVKEREILTKLFQGLWSNLDWPYSSPTAGWDIRLDTLGAEMIAEVGWANADPLK